MIKLSVFQPSGAAYVKLRLAGAANPPEADKSQRMVLLLAFVAPSFGKVGLHSLFLIDRIHYSMLDPPEADSTFIF